MGIELTKEMLIDIVGAAHSNMKGCVNEDRNFMLQRLADAAHHLWCLAALCPSMSKVETKEFFDGCIFPQVRINGLSLSEFSDRLRERRDEDRKA